jgi:hypothetical protein
VSLRLLPTRSALRFNDAAAGPSAAVGSPAEFIASTKVFRASMASALLVLIASHAVCTASVVADCCRSDALTLERAADTDIDADTDVR